MHFATFSGNACVPWFNFVEPHLEHLCGPKALDILAVTAVPPDSGAAFAWWRSANF